MIYQVAGVLAVLFGAAVFLWGMEWKKRKAAERREAEKDRLLTRQIAVNMDLEQELAGVKKNYAHQQKMAEEIRNMQVQSRSLKHDMKNHSMVLLSYLQEGKTEEAKEYTSRLLDHLNKMYTYINVGNSLLNYIINSKLSRAKEQGIEIKAEIENLAFAYMNSVDFSALLNNLLDNAAEGALRSRSKRLEVVISSRNGFDVIAVKNSIDESVLEHNPDLLSTKEGEGHGYGMKQIQSITEKYHGMTDIYEENGQFIVRAAFTA